MHESQFSNLLNYDYGSVVIPFGKVPIGFSMIRLGVDDIADTRNALIEENGNGIYEQELEKDLTLPRSLILMLLIMLSTHLLQTSQ
ncbi:MAG: hypothetical protein R3A12_06600 [Ignavibacteria bacterium]